MGPTVLCSELKDAHWLSVENQLSFCISTLQLSREHWPEFSSKCDQIESFSRKVSRVSRVESYLRSDADWARGQMACVSQNYQILFPDTILSRNKITSSHSALVRTAWSTMVGPIVTGVVLPVISLIQPFIWISSLCIKNILSTYQNFLLLRNIVLSNKLTTNYSNISNQIWIRTFLILCHQSPQKCRFVELECMTFVGWRDGIPASAVCCQSEKPCQHSVTW